MHSVNQAFYDYRRGGWIADNICVPLFDVLSKDKCEYQTCVSS